MVEHFAGELFGPATQQMPDQLHGLAQRLERAALGHADPIEPRASRQAKVCPTARGQVQQRDLTGDFERMHRIRVQRRGAQPRAMQRGRHPQERTERWLVQQVVVDADHVEGVAIHGFGESAILSGRLVALERNTEGDTAASIKGHGS